MSLGVDLNKFFEKESLPKKVLQWLLVTFTAFEMAEKPLPGLIRAAVAEITGVIKKFLHKLWAPLTYRQQMSQRRKVFLAWVEIIGVDVPFAAWFWVFGLFCSVEGAVGQGLSYNQRVGCFVTFALAMIVHKWFANSAHITLERLGDSNRGNL
jgi:hypothetical protein